MIILKIACKIQMQSLIPQYFEELLFISKLKVLFLCSINWQLHTIVTPLFFMTVHFLQKYITIRKCT